MKKLLAFSLLFALSAANAQAAGWLNPYVGIDYAYTNAGYGNYTDKALKDQTDSYVLSAGIKILPGFRGRRPSDRRGVRRGRLRSHAR